MQICQEKSESPEEPPGAMEDAPEADVKAEEIALLSRLPEGQVTSGSLECTHPTHAQLQATTSMTTQ